jgi:chloramphenicol O-acetyltransferase type A
MNIDITNFLEKTKKKGLPFYYAMTYATAITLNKVEELRYRIKDGQVILHDLVHPSFTEMSPDSDLFKIVTVDLEASIEAFIEKAKRKADGQTEYFPASELAGRDDLIYITCIPWISFTHLSHTINLRKDDSVPRISWGKYFRDGDQVLLPFSVQVNHALADGCHVGKYVEVLQNYLDTFK